MNQYDINQAIKYSNIDIVKELLESGDVDICGEDCICKEGDPDHNCNEFFEEDQEYDIAQEYMDGGHVLMTAAEYADLEILKVLTAKYKSHINRTAAVLICISKNRKEHFYHLVDCGCIDEEYYLYKYLIHCCKVGNAEIAKYLISKCNDLDVSWYADNTWSRSADNPLTEAVYHNNTEVTRLLLENGADPNTFLLQSCLGLAIHNNNLKIVKYLVAYGADIRPTHIEIAEKYNKPKIAEYLSTGKLSDPKKAKVSKFREVRRNGKEAPQSPVPNLVIQDPGNLTEADYQKISLMASSYNPFAN